jgi:Putative zinc ribbon domain
MTTLLCRSCGSCGFPMNSAEDHAGGNPESDYCSTCAEASGTLKPFDEVVNANADYFAREQGIDVNAAREMAKALLMSQPAWQAPKRAGALA